MLEIQYEKFGPASIVAKCVNAPELGEPAAWDATVKIEACTINPSDISMLQGQYGKLNKPPAKIGMEAAGTVTAVGSSITKVAVGDRVMLLANDNWAQHRQVAESALIKLPNDFDLTQAATMKVNSGTALLLLREHTNAKKAWIIQNAALSSVGRAVIAFAQQLGIKTINVVRRPEAVEEVEALGGDVAVVEDENLAENVRNAMGRGKITLAFDAVGGESTAALANCLDKNGRILNYGMLSGMPCQVGQDNLIFKEVSLHGFWLSKLLNRMPQTDRDQLFVDIIEIMNKSNYQAQIDSKYNISEIREALRRSETPQRSGKVTILPHGESEKPPEPTETDNTENA